MFRNFIQHLFSATLLALSLCTAIGQASAYAAQSYAAENNRAGFTDLEAELPSALVPKDQWFMPPAIVARYASSDGDQHPVKNPNEQTATK